jgi:hypothetical protein
VAKPGLAGQSRHRRQHHAGQAAALVARRDLGGQRAGGRRLPARSAQFKGGGHGRIDPRPQTGVGAVPGQGDGVALGQDQLLVGVVEHELPLGEDVEQLRPVVVDELAVQVVLGPDLVRETGDAVP